jgi:AAT family amino acid transporter/D-serine/D-alanine/glycine transporter
VLAFLALVAVFLGLDDGTRVALYVAPVWFGLLALGYRFTQRREVVAYA